MTNCICKNILTCRCVDFTHFIQLGSSSTSNIKAVITVITPIPDLPYERCVKYTQHKLKHAVRVSSFHKQRFLLRTLICYICVYNFMFCLSEMDGIGNTMQKKAAELERMAEVLVTGEQLR